MNLKPAQLAPQKIIKEDDCVPTNVGNGIAGTGGPGGQGVPPGPQSLLFRRKKVKIRGVV
jgi:hypothetical protein